MWVMINLAGVWADVGFFYLTVFWVFLRNWICLLLTWQVFGGPFSVTDASGASVPNPDGTVWIGLMDAAWRLRVAAATADVSVGGTYITEDEAVNITSPLPLRADGSTVPLAAVQRFVERWNNTVAYVDQGILSATVLPPTSVNPNYIPLPAVGALWGRLFNTSEFRAGVSVPGLMQQAAKDGVAALGREKAGTCASVVVRI